MRLTDVSVRALKAPANGQVTYTDDTLPGFGVRVSATGVKSFTLVVGRSRKRHTIGRYPTISLSDARTRAKEIIAGRILKREEIPEIKFPEAMERFLDAQYPKHGLKASTRIEVERMLNRYFLPPFRHEVINAISTHDVMSIIDRKKKTPSEQRHLYGVIRHFFRWAEERRYVSRSPCTGVKAPKASPPRERVLSEAELAAVFKTARSSPHSTFCNIAQLLILTGQRRGEIAGLRREWIDFDKHTITFPPAITKNRREHRIPFGPMAEEVLKRGADSGLLFPARRTEGKHPFFGWSKSKPRFDKRCPLPHWTLHDLRRTYATNLAALGVPVQVTEKMLNHVSGTFAGIVSVYQRHTYENEMRAAMEAWERQLRSLVGPVAANDDEPTIEAAE